MTNKKKMLSFTVGFLSLAVLGQFCQAQEEQGFRYNNLSVSPYVNLEYTYDSNINYSDSGEVDDNIFGINPGLDLNYKGNDWGLNGNIWFNHDYYHDNHDLNENSYGESVDLYWESPRGLSLILGQSYVNADQSDSLTDGGDGIWRNRDQFDFTGALMYRFSEKTSATLNGSYTDLSYDNETTKQYSQDLYGWKEYSVGLQLARQMTAKSDFLISGSYQEYESDGAQGGMNSSSIGYSLMAGVGSRATERIKYSILAGASMFDYAEGDVLTGFTYEANMSWILSRKWALSLAGSSYYQPSETEANQAMQVYTMSSGLTYNMTRRLTTSLDLAYRREENEYDYGTAASSDSDDRYSSRFMARYKLRKYVNLYAGLEYETQKSDEDVNEFDRFRGTLGVNLRY